MYRVIWAAAVLAGLTPSLLWAAEGASTPETPGRQPESYRSAFDGFQRFEETRESNWKAANERVREIGGHGGALAEDEETSDATASKPPHAGHHQ